MKQFDSWRHIFLVFMLFLCPAVLPQRIANYPFLDRPPVPQNGPVLSSQFRPPPFHPYGDITSRFANLPLPAVREKPASIGLLPLGPSLPYPKYTAERPEVVDEDLPVVRNVPNIIQNPPLGKESSPSDALEPLIEREALDYPDDALFLEEYQEELQPEEAKKSFAPVFRPPREELLANNAIESPNFGNNPPQQQYHQREIQQYSYHPQQPEYMDGKKFHKGSRPLNHLPPSQDYYTDEALLEEEEKPDRLSILLQQTSFHCVGRKNGYYADEELQCEVFHFCQDGVKHSWLCPNNHSFHQVHLICMPRGSDNICERSSTFHFVNDFLYKEIGDSKEKIYADRYYPKGYEGGIARISIDEDQIPSPKDVQRPEEADGRRPYFSVVDEYEAIPKRAEFEEHRFHERPPLRPSQENRPFVLRPNAAFRAAEEVDIPLEARHPRF